MKYHVLLVVITLLQLAACTIPVTPELAIKEGLISVDGFVSNFRGASYVKIYEVNHFNIGTNDYVSLPIKGAEVSFINSKTSEVVKLIEDDSTDVYLPELDFVASEGDEWELYIKLNGGEEYRSIPETMASLVDITNLSVEYKPEIEYHLGIGDFVPGHSINVTISDPPDTENFYLWSFRTFEKNFLCHVCPLSYYFRDNICQSYSDLEPEVLPPYFTYLCDADCWSIRYSQQVSIFADEFIDGSTVDLPVADILLYNKRDILVEIQQYSLSKASYKYYEILKDIVSDGSSLNAPPPAALLGNIYNPNDESELVLGRFSVAAAADKRIMIKRAGIQENAIVPDRPLIPETSPISENERVYTAPCSESRYRTCIKPEGWQ